MKNHKGEKLERWLASDLDPDQMIEFEEQVVGDAEMTEEIFAALELQAGLEEAAARGPVEKPRRLRRPKTMAWTGALMAAVLALIIILPEFQSPDNDRAMDLPLRLRGGGDSGAAIAVEPMGEVATFPRTYRWRPKEPQAQARYRWELYDEQARRRAVAIVADSVLVRPPKETPADSLGSWRWLVVELKADGLEGATSAAVEFTVIGKEKE